MRPDLPHQLSMIEYLKTTKSPELLADMRLGKSHALIKAFHKPGRRCLVVCPKPVIPVWEDELTADVIEWYHVVTSDTLAHWTEEDRVQWPEWTVANYECVRKMPEWMKDLFQVVILDEAVRIRNPKALLTKTLLKSFPFANRVIASGNVAPENPLEYFCPFAFCDGEFMGFTNFWQFRNALFTTVNGYKYFPKSKEVRERIRLHVKSRAYILRRQDVGLANQKIYQRRVVELPKGKLKTMYHQMEKTFAMTLPTGETVETKHTVAQVGYLSQMAGGHVKGVFFSWHKVQELVDLLTGELEGQSVVVWFRYNTEIDAVSNALAKAEVPHKAMTADMPLEDRRLWMKKFQRGVFPVFLVQVKLGLYGLNLSTASTAIYFSAPLSLNERVQSEDRIEHTKKKEPLLYIDLVTKDTIDEDIVKALRAKKTQSDFYLSVVENMRGRYAC